MDEFPESFSHKSEMAFRSARPELLSPPSLSPNGRIAAPIFSYCSSSSIFKRRKFPSLLLQAQVLFPREERERVFVPLSLLFSPFGEGMIRLSHHFFSPDDIITPRRESCWPVFRGSRRGSFSLLGSADGSRRLPALEHGVDFC